MCVRSGGGNLTNLGLDRAAEALIWMMQEAKDAGLKMDAKAIRYGTDNASVTESLSGVWWILEILPISRLTHTPKSRITFRLVQLHLY